MNSNQLLISVACCVFTLTSCTAANLATETTQQSNHEQTELANSNSNSSTNRSTSCAGGTKPLWSSQFQNANWKSDWEIKGDRAWGLSNSEVMDDPSRKFSKILRVRYRSGSASPRSTKLYKTSEGGTQFFATLNLPPRDSLCLSYYVRFSKNFDFVKGGKLPGLFGGTVNDGRKIPDGTNGFSTRFMWRSQGRGEVYAYLPTSKEHGTSIGRGTWRFRPGTWHHIEQQVILNQPGKQDGRIRVWLDGKPVLNTGGLTFRTTTNLQIEGVLFSTFFGGGDPSWSTPKKVYADFADFSVFAGEG